MGASVLVIGYSNDIIVLNEIKVFIFLHATSMIYIGRY